jgi:hypothetical protein
MVHYRRGVVAALAVTHLITSCGREGDEPGSRKPAPPPSPPAVQTLTPEAHESFRGHNDPLDLCDRGRRVSVAERAIPERVGLHRFIELFGLAVGNGIMLVFYINQLRNEGTQMDQAIVSGCVLRLRPVVMTMMTTLLGLLPLTLAQGIGAEVQRPLATVVIGGLHTSTVLTLVVLPALYRWFAEKEAGKEYAPEWV